MSNFSSLSEQKKQTEANFDGIAAQYDVLLFVKKCARRLIELAELPVGARVLDVGTGTGLVAMVAGQVAGPAGRVVGVDLSKEMLNSARQKIAAAGLSQVEFRQGDAEHLDLPDHSFDVVFFASTLFFVPDMKAALREAWRVLVPGGRVGFNGFGATFLNPVRQLWGERLRSYHLATTPPPVERLADPAVCQQLLQEAGFSQAGVQTEQLGYYFSSPEQRWQEICAGVEGLPLKGISSELREEIHAVHVAELASLMTEQGLWIDIPANFAFGIKSGD
jgi:ubiquinone/menaquinone biosynthesis C-methylase UbiE